MMAFYATVQPLMDLYLISSVNSDLSGSDKSEFEWLVVSD